LDPIKVFIGTEEAQTLPTEVLKYSIRRRTANPVEFHLLRDIPLKLNKKMYTGFSFFRFAIPQFCDYKGKAIYLDADMVVLGDIAELYSLPFAGKGALARPCPPASWYTSAMVLDCALLKHWDIFKWETLINAGVASYKGTLWGETSGLTYQDFAPLPEYWNHLDTFDATTKNIHYTNVPRQPWKTPGHPFAAVFLKELKAAMHEGVVSETDVKKEIASEHIYADILKDVETQ
jgi:lipopolysaccharide biosynthesis glycosyltransferase